MSWKGSKMSAFAGRVAFVLHCDIRSHNFRPSAAGIRAILKVTKDSGRGVVATYDAYFIGEWG